MNPENSTGPHLHFSTEVSTGTPVYAAKAGSITRDTGPGYMYRGIRQDTGCLHDVWKVPIEHVNNPDWKQHSKYVGAYTTTQIANGEHRK